MSNKNFSIMSKDSLERALRLKVAAQLVYLECMLSIKTILVSISHNQEGHNCATFISFEGDLLPVNLFLGVIILLCTSIHSRVYNGGENMKLPNNKAKHILLVLHLNANISYRCSLS